MSRQTKTPKQRAEETRDRALRRLKRARERLDKAEADAKAAATEWREAQSDYDYATLAPALKVKRPATDVTAQTGAGAVTTTVGKA